MELGPGSYKDPPKFGDDVRDHTIGGPRREGPKNENPGPGAYLHEHADPHTKYLAPAWTIPQKKRGESIESDERGPGEYNEHRNFGDNLNNFTIGHRKDK